MSLTVVHSAMTHIVEKYQITTTSGEAVTVEQLMDNSDLVSILTNAMGKRSGRPTTSPGQKFNSELCRCRIWDGKTGLPKQCPNSMCPPCDGDTGMAQVCKTHAKKISETEEQVWKFGFFDEELPMSLLSGKDKGKSIAWKVEGYEPRRRSGASKPEPGKHPRPKGRAPKGKVWNYDLGQWDDSDVIPEPSKDTWPQKISELKKLAKDAGITSDELDVIDDCKNRRSALIKYLKSKGSTSPVVDTTPTTLVSSAPAIQSTETVAPTTPAATGDLLSMFEPEPEVSSVATDAAESEGTVFGDTTLTFEGVEYMWDKGDNELTDPESYDVVGKWNPESKVIEFESEEMKVSHKNNENNIHNK